MSGAFILCLRILPGVLASVRANMALIPNIPKAPLVDVRVEAWPLERPFVIARGSKTSADILAVELREGDIVGRGEAVPYARYGEDVHTVADTLREALSGGSVGEVYRALGPGAARNALDCALWDFEAKRTGQRVYQILGLPAPAPVQTAFTISLGSPDDMAAQARAARPLTLLKLKLGGGRDDLARMRAVRAERPDARLVADANEAWAYRELQTLCACAAELSFETVEQPLAADDDAALAEFESPVPLCADESVHTSGDISRACRLYQAVNIKLDKAGGLSEALAMKQVAREAGLKIMIGSMVSTSLGVAPALLLGFDADWVDLDGPLLLKEDRAPGLAIRGGVIASASPALWG